MATLAELFNQAVQYHQSGQPALAEPLYRQILQADPQQADVHNNLGNALLGQGKTAEAIACYRQALQCNPGHALAHYNLGNVFKGKGQLEEAIAYYRQALRFNPHHANTYNNLGNALKDSGQRQEALACFQQALNINPHHGEVHFNLGNTLKEMGQLDDAIASFQQALRINPDHAGAYNNLGGILKDMGNREEAIACCRQALRINPDHADALNNLGAIFLDQGQESEAIACFQRALAINPNHADAYNNLGNALVVEGELDEAIATFQQALRLNSSHVNAHFNLANTLKQQAKLDEACASYQEAIRLQPDFDEAHFNLSCLWLLKGNYEIGWPGYDYRLRLKRLHFPAYPQPRWDGSPLNGKTILLHAEQGFGDTLQFVRYAPYVKRLGGTVLLECPAELVRILHSCAGIDQIIPSGSSLPPFDVQVPLLSLPGILQTTLATIPASIPYLAADGALIQHWRSKLATEEPSPGLNIGVIWQGDPRFSQPECRLSDKKRSIPLSQFEPLACLPGVRLFSLQKGYGLEQLAKWKSRWNIVELGESLNDFMDTAAVMMNLDLIISADTSPLHLAGALGRQVWAVLPFSGCWRWLQDRGDTPWYPTMRLFRQSKPGDWESVFEEMASAIRTRLV